MVTADVLVAALVCGTALVLALLAVRELRRYFPGVNFPSTDPGAIEALEERITEQEKRTTTAFEQLSTHALALGLREKK